MTVAAALAAAGTYVAVKNYERAILTLSLALHRYPENDALLTELARAYFCVQQLEAAVETARSALRVAPTNADALRIYALACYRLCDYDTAVKVASRSVSFAPEDYKTHYTCAIVLHAAGRHQHALLAVRKALRLKSTSPDVHFQHGLILAALDQIEGSNDAYAEVLRLAPTHSGALHNIALNALERGDWRQALLGFLGAARMDPPLGNLARANIVVALSTPLRRTTCVAIFICSLLIGSSALRSGSVELAGVRIATAVTLISLGAQAIWVICSVRIIPRRARWALLRAEPVLGMRAIIPVGATVVAISPCFGARMPVLVTSAVVLLLVSVWVAVIGWRRGV